MKKILLGLALISASLSSCSSITNSSKQAFRNRENDYVHQTVSTQAPLVTPPGLNPIKTNPVLTIPSGPDSYQPQPKAVNLAPPTLSS